MTYERKKKKKKRRIRRDPLTGNSVKMQHRMLSKSDKDDYLNDEGHFDLQIFNDENEENCDLCNTSSMAAAVDYTRQHFEDWVLPEIDTYRVGPIYVTCTNSIKATVAEYRKKQAAKQSEAGKKNSGNLLRWSKTDVSSGGFND